MKAWKYIAEGFVSVFTFYRTPSFSNYEKDDMESVYKELIKVRKETNREYKQEINQLMKQYKKSQRVSKRSKQGHLCKI